MNETKIITFDMETAKKIQAGVIEGKILLKNHIVESIRIVCWDRHDTHIPIIGLIDSGGGEGVFYAKPDGTTTDGDVLVLMVPDNHTITEFKPFDRVLVRNTNTPWFPALFYQKYNTGFRMIGGELWDYCIPYEGNESLIGTWNNKN